MANEMQWTERDLLLQTNRAHQKLNGELQVRLSQYEDQAAHYRRKGVL